MATEQFPKPVKLYIDKEADALYLRLDDGTIVESEEVAPGVVLDYNEATTDVRPTLVSTRNLSSQAHTNGP